MLALVHLLGLGCRMPQNSTSQLSDWRSDMAWSKCDPELRRPNWPVHRLIAVRIPPCALSPRRRPRLLPATPRSCSYDKSRSDSSRRPRAPRGHPAAAVGAALPATGAAAPGAAPAAAGAAAEARRGVLPVFTTRAAAAGGQRFCLAGAERGE